MKCSVEGCNKPHYGRGLCKAHHQWRWARGLIEPKPTMTIADKIVAYSMPVTESGCWIWMRNCNNRGYGTVSLGNQMKGFAHRTSYETFVGPIPDGMSVCHKCDVPACVNPAHLFLGTHQENMQDSVRKGRSRVPPPMHGANHPRARFSQAEVDAIRADRRIAKEIAADYGVCRLTIYRVRNRESYV